MQAQNGYLQRLLSSRCSTGCHARPVLRRVTQKAGIVAPEPEVPQDEIAPQLRIPRLWRPVAAVMNRLAGRRDARGR